MEIRFVNKAFEFEAEDDTGLSVLKCSDNKDVLVTLFGSGYNHDYAYALKVVAFC